MSEMADLSRDGRPLIRAVIAEDSVVNRDLLNYILSSDPAIEVIGIAHDGEEALEMVGRLKPDVVVMDIHMPRMDGLEATRRIMATHPVPIVISSGSSVSEEGATAFHALESGALSYVPRPAGVGHPEHERMARELVDSVKLMSEVKVVRRTSYLRKVPMARPVLTAATGSPGRRFEVVAMGASTGGPIAIKDILSALPRDFPVPILIVQHMTKGFIGGFVNYLAQASGFTVTIGAQDEPLVAGKAYIAPDGFHMQVSIGKRIMLTQEPPENGLRPSVSRLFLSTAHVFREGAIGVLLTGMGKDGARELKLMKDNGSITIAQDEASSVIWGMPGEATKTGAATYVMPLQEIAKALVSLTMGQGAGFR
jgi:two-component system chemotaxis response regulator CheB